METPPNRIRELREAAGLSQDALGARAGMTKSSLHRVETGDTQLDLPTMRRIGAALGVKPSALLHEQDVEARLDGSTAAIMTTLMETPEAERAMLAEIAQELSGMGRRNVAAATGGLTGDKSAARQITNIWNGLDAPARLQLLALIAATGFADRAGVLPP